MLQSVYNKVSIVILVVFVLFILYLDRHLSSLSHAPLNKQAIEDMVKKYKTRIEVGRNRVRIVYKDRVIEKYIPPEGGLVYEEDKITGETKLDITTWGRTNRFGFQTSFFPLGGGFTYKLFFIQRFGTGIGFATFPKFTENSAYKSLLLGTAITAWGSYRVGNNTQAMLGYRASIEGSRGLYGGLQWDF